LAAFCFCATHFQKVASRKVSRKLKDDGDDPAHRNIALDRATYVT
jgi:hypothetical protein